MKLIELLGIASMIFVAFFTYNTAKAGGDPRAAIIEAWFNLVIGFSLNFVANMLVIPLAVDHGHMSASGNFWMGWVFTTISIVRQYSIRRWFQARVHAAALRLARKDW